MYLRDGERILLFGLLSVLVVFIVVLVLLYLTDDTSGDTIRQFIGIRQSLTGALW